VSRPVRLLKEIVVKEYELGRQNVIRNVRGITLVSCGLALMEMAFGAPVLTGDTSKPAASIFYPKDRVSLYFHVSGLAAFQKDITLKLTVENEDGKVFWGRDCPVKPDANGQDEVIVTDAPGGRLGFYRLRARLSDGTLLTTPWATRQPGQLTWAVVPAPEEREPVDVSYLRFFNSGDPDLVGRMAVDRVGPTNPKIGPFGITSQWRHLEAHRPGEYADDPEADRIPLPYAVGNLYTHSTAWGNDLLATHFKMQGHADGHPPALTPAGEKAWEAFVKTFARNFRRQYPTVPRVYEFTAEYYAPDNGSRTLKDIVRMYEVGYKALKSEDPEGLVAGPGFGYAAKDYHQLEFLKAGLARWLDVITEHSYYTYPAEPNGIVDAIRTSRQLVRQYAGRDLAFYSTEFGYATEDFEPRERDQLRHILRVSLILFGEGFKALSAFVPSDYRLEPGFGYTYNLALIKDVDRKDDWFHNKTSPKPIYPAYAALTHLLVNSETLGDVPFLGETAWGYVFRKANTGRIILALWDWSGTPRAVKLPAGVPVVDVVDCMGNSRTVKTVDGELSLTLTDVPQYVTGVSPDVWTNPMGERAKLAAAFQARQKAARSARGVEITGVSSACMDDGRAAMDVTLANLRAETNEGVVRVRVKGNPDGRASAPYRLSPEQTVSVKVPMAADFVGAALMNEEVEVAVEQKAGPRVECGENVNFLFAPYRPKVAVDGIFDDWKDVPISRFDPARQLTNGKRYYKGPDDCTATLSVCWDDRFLKFLFDVVDDQYVPPPASKTVWSRDSVQMAFSGVYHLIKTGNMLQDKLNEAATECTWGLTEKGPYAYRHVSFDNAICPRGPLDLSTHPFHASIALCANGKSRIRYEIAVPWRDMRVAEPKVGVRVGWACTVNDWDPGKPAYSAFGAFNLKIPDQFGAIVLTP